MKQHIPSGPSQHSFRHQITLHPTNAPHDRFALPHQAPGTEAAPAAAAAATSARLRQWVDTASDAAYVLLHSRVEARAGRCGPRALTQSRCEPQRGGVFWGAAA
jgi:hypothetical protein